MALELGVWRIDQGLQRLPASGLDLESRLEDLLDRDISIASPEWMVIGRQVPTPHGGRIDLLALDRDGNLVVIELKRDHMPRDILTQVLDYGSWVRTLRAEDIAPIFNEYRKRRFPGDAALSIDEAFQRHFGLASMPEELNERHELVIVGSTFDPDTERIVTYLADEYGVNINAVFFRVFKDQEREYLTRAWLREPAMVDLVTTASAASSIATGPHPKTDWNGEYYVSFGHGDKRHWEDARRFGFISAGGGEWYSNTLNMLEPGSRIWVNIPSYGYAGVGKVMGPRRKVDQFTVPDSSGRRIPILQTDTLAKDMGNEADDPVKAEYLVPVEWIKTVSLNEAVREKGFFGNQNSAARPRDAKWSYTVDRLRDRFGVRDDAGSIAANGDPRLASEQEGSDGMPSRFAESM